MPVDRAIVSVPIHSLTRGGPRSDHDVRIEAFRDRCNEDVETSLPVLQLVNHEDTPENCRTAPISLIHCDRKALKNSWYTGRTAANGTEKIIEIAHRDRNRLRRGNTALGRHAPTHYSKQEMCSPTK